MKGGEHEMNETVEIVQERVVREGERLGRVRNVKRLTVDFDMGYAQPRESRVYVVDDQGLWTDDQLYFAIKHGFVDPLHEVNTVSHGKVYMTTEALTYHVLNQGSTKLALAPSRISDAMIELMVATTTERVRRYAASVRLLSLARFQTMAGQPFDHD